MDRHWQLLQPDPAIVKELSRALKCHPVTAAILANRRIVSARQALEFFDVSLRRLHPPFGLKDMNTAVQRIFEAIRRHEKILIFGDYDVDGVTATTILLDFLQHAGADVSYYIPDRLTEGYSLQPRHISQLAAVNKISLIITADCGSASHAALIAAARFKIDVIVTDHHNVSENLPPAAALINPKRLDCSAGLAHLAGVGVAFCLLICLRKFLRDKDFWQKRPEPNLKNLCDLVALGTIADMVPLIGENRIFSKTGLELMSSGRRYGLSALIEAAGIRNNLVDSADIAFKLAPRLNAAGRMAHASTAVNLLTAKDDGSARQIAQLLNGLNQKRQQLEKNIMEDIQAQLLKSPQLLAGHTLVLSHPGWHAGVLGIVASRLAEKFFRPVVLFSVRDGHARGSARSIPGLDLYSALSACAEWLDKFGGHPMAAGLSLDMKNMARFHKCFEAAVSSAIRPEDLVPKVFIDCDLDFSCICDSLIDELESLMPFGAGNPEPLFMARDVTVASSRIVGKNHRRMVLCQRGGARCVNAIQFNIDPATARDDRLEQIAFRLRWNRWNGQKTAQLVIEEMRAHPAAPLAGGGP